jgi:hypothetical protein
MWSTYGVIWFFIGMLVAYGLFANGFWPYV